MITVRTDFCGEDFDILSGLLRGQEVTSCSLLNDNSYAKTGEKCNGITIFFASGYSLTITQDTTTGDDEVEHRLNPLEFELLK
jgi:hypothetical protein